MIRFDDFGLGDPPEDKKPSDTWAQGVGGFRAKPEMPSPEEFTIASLNINIVAAESGRLFELLPPDYRRHGDRYPLPKPIADLARIAALKLSRGGKCQPTGVGVYIKRCRIEHKRQTRNRKMDHSYSAALRVRQEADKAKQDIGNATAEIEATLSDFRKKANEATASLTDLYSLAKSGLEKVMKGYVDGTDETITAPIFTAAAGKVLQQVAKLGAGMDPEGKDESEEAVFAEYEATRARLARSSGKIAPSGGESEPH